MLDLNKHRDDFVKTIYDLLKIWITLSIITPIISKNMELSGLVLSVLTSLVLFLAAIIIRQGGEK
jgi:hypothetical protein